MQLVKVDLATAMTWNEEFRELMRLSRMWPLRIAMILRRLRHTLSLFLQMTQSIQADAGTEPDNTPSPSDGRQAAADGAGANRDASSSKDTSGSRLKRVWKSTNEVTTRGHTMAARSYDLEYLKNGIAMDQFN